MNATQRRANAFRLLTEERDRYKMQLESCQEALAEVMSELTECRKEHEILFRRLTKSAASNLSTQAANTAQPLKQNKP